MNLHQPMVKDAEKPFRIMDLPLEVRDKILGKLLPDLVEVRGYSEYWSDESKHQFRGDKARCHIDIMCVSQQLYDEASRILYNRAFNITIDVDGVTFLNDIHHAELPIALPTFPWHKAKQLRIVLLADDLALYLLLIRSNLVRVCKHLYSAASFEYIRVDLFDLTYWADEPLENFPTTDDDHPHPADDKYSGFISPFRSLVWPNKALNFKEELNNAYKRKGRVDAWGRTDSIPTNSNAVLPYATDLELILQPLRLLRKVVKATINLPPLAEEHAESKKVAEDCEKVMMRDVKGDEWELEQARMDWYTERYWSRPEYATKNSWE